MVRLILSLVVFVVFASCAFAHDAGLSGIKIIQRAHDYVVSVMLHRSALQQAEHQENLTLDEIQSATARRLRLTIDGRQVGVNPGLLLTDEANDSITLQYTNQGSAAEIECHQRLFPEIEGSKTILTVLKGGQIDQEILLDERHPSYPELVAKESGLNLAARYIQMGCLHILSGADHILFVLGLLMLGGGIKSLLKTVTAFTIAHSLTLTLSVTGILNPSSRWVEPSIALSIVAIAYENLRPKPEATDVPVKDYRPWVAFGFGLIHGFGFAGALAEVGLEGPQLGIALATFNLGVELGQAGIILLAAPAIGWFSTKQPAKWKVAMSVVSVLIGLIGSFWFIQRLN